MSDNDFKTVALVIVGGLVCAGLVGLHFMFKLRPEAGMMWLAVPAAVAGAATVLLIWVLTQPNVR